MSVSRPILLLTLLLPVAGCFVNIPLTDRPCESDADCLEDSACVAALCVGRVACTTDGDCPDDRACGDGACREPRGTDSGPNPVVDAGPDEDDAGNDDVDGGPDDVDGGPGDVDAGPNGADAGPNGVDAGPGNADAGPGDLDAGPNLDAGVDGGAPDVDAGPDGGVLCHGDPVEVCAPAALVRKLCRDASAECDPGPDFSSAGSAVDALQGIDGYLFVYGGRYFLERSLSGTRSLTIVGEDGAAFFANNRLLRVSENASLTLRGVEVSGDNDGDGDRDTGSYPLLVEDDATLIVEDCVIGPSQREGVESYDNARLEIRRSIIRNNTEGGVDVGNSVVAILENNLFDNSGQSGGNGSSLGNVRLDSDQPSLFRYNTVVSGNRKSSGDVGGVICGEPQHLYSSIIWNNNGPEVSSNCVLHTSLVQGRGDADAGVLDTDPLFVGSGDYHLQPGSPAIDTGTEATSPDFPNELAPNLDGDYETRPTGADRDMGYDEVP